MQGCEAYPRRRRSDGFATPRERPLPHGSTHVHDSGFPPWFRKLISRPFFLSCTLKLSYPPSPTLSTCQPIITRLAGVPRCVLLNTRHRPPPSPPRRSFSAVTPLPRQTSQETRARPHAHTTVPEQPQS